MASCAPEMLGYLNSRADSAPRRELHSPHECVGAPGSATRPVPQTFCAIASCFLFLDRRQARTRGHLAPRPLASPRSEPPTLDRMSRLAYDSLTDFFRCRSDESKTAHVAGGHTRSMGRNSSPTADRSRPHHGYPSGRSDLRAVAVVVAVRGRLWVIAAGRLRCLTQHTTTSRPCRPS